MQKYVFIVIHKAVSRVMSFARNIIDSYSQMNKNQLVIKFNLTTRMVMDNAVTGLTISNSA